MMTPKRSAKRALPKGRGPCDKVGSLSAMTNNEINQAVAKRMGWVQCCNPGTMENGKIVDCFGWSKGGSHFHALYPDYCGSIQAAWEVVEKLRETELVALCYHDGAWHLEINCVDGKREVDEEAGTAPMAICKAFLKLP